VSLNKKNVRLRNQIAKGTCPACGWVCADLRGHMAKEHPGFAEELHDDQRVGEVPVVVE
jgi:hypothetical protein